MSALLESMRLNLQPGWVLYDVGLLPKQADYVGVAIGRSLARVHVIGLHPDEPSATLGVAANDVPDAIVMDVAGAELEVLKGADAREILLNTKPMLWISCHPVRMTDHYHWGVTYLWKFLREYGYSWRLLDYDDALEIVAWHPNRPATVDP